LKQTFLATTKFEGAKQSLGGIAPEFLPPKVLKHFTKSDNEATFPKSHATNVDQLLVIPTPEV